MDSIDIRFIGICCFAVGPNGNELYKRRVLFPYDKRGYHIPFVEIAVADIEGPIGGNLNPIPLPNKHTYCHPPIKPGSELPT